MEKSMAEFETRRKNVADAGENLRKAQLEIGNLIPREEDRARVAVLLNNVQDALVEVNEGYAKDDERDSDTDSGVREGFDRTEANKAATNQASRDNAARASGNRK
jgi:hypothetical protein